ncbi:C1q-like domain-containing protein [Halobacillus sp. H74]|uniref:C1q-like domain-containing protein n=1 Tax=Halobacillus sp. H74 TaxID=3457436 RepID=UPI003FCD52B4
MNKEELLHYLLKEYLAHSKIEKNTNIGNPVVNVNVSGCSGESKHDKKDEKDKSAFRAIKSAATPIPIVNSNFKVSFNNEKFDLNNEYNSITSAFVAEEAGVYLFTATLSFNPNNANVDYEFGLQLTVNGTEIDVDADYTGFNAVYFNTTDISEIVRLQAGDTVEIVALSTTPGVIPVEQRSSFAGARLS